MREDGAKSERTIRFFESIVEDVRNQFSKHFMDICSFQVAASPQSSGTQRGEGMVDLLYYWMSEPGRLSLVAVPQQEPEANRVFGRLRPLDMRERDE